MKALILDFDHEQYWVMNDLSEEEYEQLLDDEQFELQASCSQIEVWSNGNLEVATTSINDMSEEALQTAIQLMYYQCHNEKREIDWDKLGRVSPALKDLMLGRTVLDGPSDNEKYFIGSEGNEPLELYFNWQTAVSANHKYIDSFDENGQSVKQYLRIQDWVYTTDF